MSVEIKRNEEAMRGDGNGRGITSEAGGNSEAPSGKQGRPTRCNICKETGLKWFSAPSGSAVSAARLATIPILSPRL